jgi:WD40 repeat protein
VRSRGVEKVIADLEIGLDWWGNDRDHLKELKLLHGAMRLSAYILSQDPGQLTTQLQGRLLEEESQGISSLLDGARKSRRGYWLRPLRASLAQPGGPLIQTLAGHTDDVNAVAVTPDGRRAVSGSWDNRVILWDLESGEPLDSFWGDSGITACAALRDGKTIVAGESSGRFHFLRIEGNE